MQVAETSIQPKGSQCFFKPRCPGISQRIYERHKSLSRIQYPYDQKDCFSSVLLQFYISQIKLFKINSKHPPVAYENQIKFCVCVCQDQTALCLVRISVCER